MTCPDCGHEFPPGATTCPNCGAPDPADAPTRIDAPTPPPTGTPPATPASTGSSFTPIGTGGFSPGSAAAYDAIRPGMLLGQRYEVVSVLGKGGMGIVYRASDIKLGREVALKVIRPDLLENAEVAERFRREILLSSKITHKNVLRIHDLVESDDLAYISMNFVEGQTLHDLMHEKGPLDVGTLIPLVVQLCDALQAAHDEGVIHRDLKPQNVLLDNAGTAYIADFGISRSLDAGETMTQEGQVLGTVNYMPPEQARGETPDHRGDLYALGMVLYKMLAGVLPFESEQLSSFQGMMRRLQQEVPDIQKVRPDIPKWLAAVVSRALRRDPAERYQSATELKQDLERHEATTSWRQVAPRPKTVLRLVTVLGVVALIALAVVVVPRLLSTGETSSTAGVVSTPKASLAVLPMRNLTGDPGYDWTGAGLPDLIRTDLVQSGALRLVEAERVRGVFEGLRIDSSGDLRSDTLRRVAGLLGADNLMTASLLKVGSTFRIEAQLQRVTGSNVSPGASFRVEGQGEDALFGLVDELADRVRDDLGLSARGQKNVAEVSTDSLEALRLYQEGLELGRTGQHLEAATRFEESLVSDPDFAVAHAALAETYDQLGQFEEAVAEADKALQGLSRVSSHEAARIQAVKAWLDYDLQSAEQAYVEMTRNSPNSAAAFLDLATVQEERGRLAEALESVSRVLELDPKHAEAQYTLGRVHAKLGNTGEALGQFSAALVTHMETENDEGRATVLNGIGNTYLSISQYAEALENYEKSLEIRQRIGDRRGAAKTIANVAIVLSRQGRLDEAIRKQQEALDILRELGEPGALAEAHSSLGDFYQEAGDPERALESYQESMKILRDLGDEASLAWNLSSIGYVNTVLGNYVEAFFFLKESLAKRRELDDKSEISVSLHDLGILEQIQGRYEEAVKYDMEGLSLARELGNKELIVGFSLNLSNINEDQGEYGAALSRLADAEQIARKIGEKRLIASCLADIGTTRLRLGDLDGAGVALDSALKLAQEIDNPALLAKISGNQSTLLRARGDSARAMASAREAGAAAERAMDRRLILIAGLRAAESAGSGGELEEIRAEAESLGLTPLVTQAHLALARLNLEGQQLKVAQGEAEKAIESADALNQRDLLFQARDLAARSLAAQGAREPAFEQIMAALDTLEELRQGLEGDALASLLAREQTAAFRDGAGQLIQALGRPEAARRLDEVAR